MWQVSLIAKIKTKRGQETFLENDCIDFFLAVNRKKLPLDKNHLHCAFFPSYFKSLKSSKSSKSSK